MLTARVHVDVCICVWKSPIWKQLLAVRALRHPQCLSLWPKRNVSPSPFFLSVSPSLSFFATSLFLYLFLFPLFPHWIKLLSYESQQKGKVKPLSISFIYLFLLGTIPPHRSPCNHILIQITHYQFVQTSPENTSTN